MKQKRTEYARMNFFALIGWVVLVTVIVVAYLLEVIKGERTILYWLALALIGYIPIIISVINYRRDTENKLQRMLLTYGYLVLYAFVVLSGDTVLTFIYIFPLLSADLVYSDRKLIRNLSIIAIIVNLIKVVLRIANGETSADNIADYEIQVLGTIITLTYAYFCCRITQDINERQMEDIQRQGETQQDVFNQVMSAAGVLSEKVSQVDARAKDIENQSSSAQSSIEEIATGTADVADNVQRQLEMSNGISEELENLTRVSGEIQDKFEETHKMSQLGIENVDELSRSADLVARSKEEVSGATASLVAALNEAEEIVSLIRSIASQTSLLALNASIEAARAGEQGRGFAVVADEIQKLSGETGDATDKIGGILESLAVEADKVNSAVENLDTLSTQQNALISKTDEQFRTIDQNITDITDGVQMQTSFLSNINDNNMKIADSISNTSAYTQQLTANSENTMNLTKESLEGTKEMTSFLNEILLEVQNLQSMK